MKKRLFFFVLLLTTFINKPTGAQTFPESLRIDYQVNPLGTDNPSPDFSWTINSAKRGSFQTAYEIWLSPNEENLKTGKNLIWQTGKINGNQSFGIKYTEKPLLSFTRYHWRIRIWDEKGIPSNWSSTFWFETAMMNPSDWKASWISNQRTLPLKDEDFYKEIPNPLLRKAVSIKKEVMSARLYIAGLGYYVAYINGQRVGDHMLDPGWTQYDKEILYSTYDVTRMLPKGANVLGIMLGNGWYNPLPIRLFQSLNLREHLTIGKPCLKAQLYIKYRDGSTETIVTNNSWKAGDGPVLKNSIYTGEMYDARKEQTGWNTSAFDDSRWEKAMIVPGPKGQLMTQYAPPIRITKIVKPIKITEPKPGVYLFDFGQNFAGVPRLKLNGKAGDTIVLRGGEDIHPDGSLNFLTVIPGQLKSIWNLNGGPGCPKDPINTITYILKGQGEETYTPQFTFSTFRYLEIKGFPGKPDLNTVEGLRMNSDLLETGSFECSNVMFNRLQEVIKWTFLSNVFSIQSDCPAREKFGYGADIVTTAESFCYNYNMHDFYKKTIHDFANDVRPKGGMTETAPFNGLDVKGIGDHSGPLGWQLAFPYCLKQLYSFYGDKTIVESYYQTLKRQIEFIRSIYPDNIVPEDISDHASIDPKPEALTATAFYLQQVDIMAEFAEILGIQNDKIKYQNLAKSIRDACTEKFLKVNSGIFDNGTQAAQLFALVHKLVPENEKEAVLKQLVEEIFYKHKGHLSTGIYATKYLFDVSRTENRNDIAYTVTNQRQFPGYGFMLDHGATTLWESWSYPDTSESQNHPMFGSVGEWFYRSLLGINTIDPGFRNFYIKPQPAGDLVWVKGYFDTPVGRIGSDWKIEGIHFYLNVTVPANTKAMIYVPSQPGKPILEGGQIASSSEGLTFIKYADGYALFEAMSGKYAFLSITNK